MPNFLSFLNTEELVTLQVLLEKEIPNTQIAELLGVDEKDSALIIGKRTNTNSQVVARIR